MARRKTHKKKSVGRKRSRRMGAAKTGITSALFTIVGGVAARFVSNAINGMNLDASYKGYVASAAPIAVGLFLPKFVKSEMGKSLGNGMIAVGGLGLVQSTGVLSGLPAIAKRYMALAPTPQNSRGVIAGMDTRSGMDTRTAAVLSC